MEQARTDNKMDHTVDTMKEDDSFEKRGQQQVKIMDPVGEDSDSQGDVQMNENEFERTAIRCFRYFIIILMLSATIAAGVASFNYLHGEEGRDFQKEVRRCDAYCVVVVVAGLSKRCTLCMIS